MSTRIRLALLSGLLAGGCVRVDGGAVEISWVVRSTDGRAITDCTCADPQIAYVRLNLTGVGGDIDGTMPCAGRTACEFPCQRQTGSTPFDIRQGHPGSDGQLPQYQIYLTALDANRQEVPAGVQSPAPILRSVVQGQPTEVEAFLLVARCSNDCAGTNSSGVCTRP
ncbi:MAG TPA: hypothetical protein VFH68_15525 [Polyangia bacterium]|jgi:hypothetical protein|nr:hypothetical protein [Polyangia bacterium]